MSPPRSDLMIPVDSTGVVSDLPDLTDVPLADLPYLSEELIADALGRVLRRADDPESVTAGYNPQRLD